MVKRAARIKEKRVNNEFGYGDRHERKQEKKKRINIYQSSTLRFSIYYGSDTAQFHWYYEKAIHCKMVTLKNQISNGINSHAI